MRETDFLAGGGELGERIRHHDWAATPLGPLSDWPQPLRDLANLSAFLTRSENCGLYSYS